VADQIPLSLSTNRLSLTAGAQPVAVEITLGNKQQIVDELLVTVSGGQPDWYDLSSDHVPLFPDESAKVTLRVHPPQRWDVQAGDTVLTISVQSRADPSVVSTASVVLSIAPTGGFEADLIKSEATGDSGVYVLRLANQSNAPASFAIGASDPGGILQFTIPEPTLTLTPFQDRDHIEITAQRIDPKTTGGRVARFTVAVQPLAAGLGSPAAHARRVDGTLLPNDAPPVKTPMPPMLKYAVPIAAIAVIAAVVAFASGVFGGGSSNGSAVVQETQAPPATVAPGQPTPTLVATRAPAGTPTRVPTGVAGCRPIITCNAGILQIQRLTATSNLAVFELCERQKPAIMTLNQCTQFVQEQNPNTNPETVIRAGQTINFPK
jgi:hypothetical protein